MKNKIFKLLVWIFFITSVAAIVIFGVGFYLDKRAEKLEVQQANAKLPEIEEQIDKIIKANTEIYDIETFFEYGGTNYICAYISDLWFQVDDIQKKRFVAEIRDNVKAILIEEGFIETGDRVGIYVYTIDGILLAEDNMYGEIKLKD